MEKQEKPAKRPRRKFSDEFKRDAVEIVNICNCRSLS